MRHRNFNHLAAHCSPPARTTAYVPHRTHLPDHCRIFPENITQQTPLQQYFINVRVALLAQQRNIKHNFIDQPGATASLATVKECSKAVRRRLRCLTADRIHSENLPLETDLEAAATSNDSKEARRCERALAARSLGPKNRYFIRLRTCNPTSDE